MLTRYRDGMVVTDHLLHPNDFSPSIMPQVDEKTEDGYLEYADWVKRKKSLDERKRELEEIEYQKFLEEIE